MAKLRAGLSLMMLALLLALPLSTFAQTSDPLSVTNAWLDTINKGNVDQALSYFADDAVVKLIPPGRSGGTFSGKQQIQTWLQNGINNHQRLEIVGTLQVAGEKVTGVSKLSADDLKAIGVDFLESNVEEIVSGGKIKSLTSTTTPASLAKLPQGGGPAAGAGLPATGNGGVVSSPSTDTSNWLISGLAGIMALCLVGFGWRRAASNRK